MNSNEFQRVVQVLSDDYILEYPQSGERIRGRDNFVKLNQEYPAKGRWQFRINRLFGNNDEVVSDVSVAGGIQNATVISFFTVHGEKIVKMVEYWPDSFPPPENRKHLVEMIHG
jgi:hypothetical protein